ncbi:MAG: hypothetical protein ACFCVE_14680 [Phycisphaerae bacterium]
MRRAQVFLRVQLDEHARAVLNQLGEQHGLSQAALVRKLLYWYVKQNEVIHLAVLGLVSSKLLGVLARFLIETPPQET